MKKFRFEDVLFAVVLAIAMLVSVAVFAIWFTR